MRRIIAKFVDIHKAPFGTVVGGVKENSDARVMVIAYDDGLGTTLGLVLVEGANPYDKKNEIAWFGGRWQVYSDE